jgi:hypothetical protein
MNRIKELPQALKVIGKTIPRMPLERTPDDTQFAGAEGPINMNDAAFAVGFSVAQFGAMGLIEKGQGPECARFVRDFTDPRELVDAIWGKEGGE